MVVVFLALSFRPVPPATAPTASPPDIETPSDVPPAPDQGRSAADQESVQTINVSLTDFSFTPKDLKLEAGKSYTLKFNNAADKPHTFTVDALALDSGVVPAGETRTVSFSAPANPGVYESYCAVPGHKDLGMVGTLEIK